MSANLARDHRSADRRPPVSRAAVRAIALALAETTLAGATLGGTALASAALAPGPHHATTDSDVSRSALLVAAVVLAACAYPAVRSGAPAVSLYAIGLALRRTYDPPPRPRRAPRPTVALPRPHALVVLLHRAQPCAP